jgi:PEGA domain
MYAPPAVEWGVTSDARFLVTPSTAEVYVDGALAGIVDQYDGVFQSLALSPGTHQFSFYLDGHRRYDTNVYVAPGSTVKVRHTMEPLAAGASADERPTPPARDQPGSQVQSPGSSDAVPVPGLGQPGVPREPQAARQAVGEGGLLIIRMQPADAEILIDGQRWPKPDANQPLEVRVPAGRVRVEVRKTGFAPFSTEIAVQPGEITPLNISLSSPEQRR